MRKAIKAAGNLSELARICDITRGAVAQWDRIPIERVNVIAEATGVSREILRPDIFLPREAAE